MVRSTEIGNLRNLLDLSPVFSKTDLEAHHRAKCEQILKGLSNADPKEDPRGPTWQLKATKRLAEVNFAKDALLPYACRDDHLAMTYLTHLAMIKH